MFQNFLKKGLKMIFYTSKIWWFSANNFWMVQLQKFMVLYYYDKSSTPPPLLYTHTLSIEIDYSITKSTPFNLHNGSPDICARLSASRSRMTVPFFMQLRRSKRLWRESVATWGLLHFSPPSSMSSSNFTQRAVSFHSTLRNGET